MKQSNITLTVKSFLFLVFISLSSNTNAEERIISNEDIESKQYIVYFDNGKIQEKGYWFDNKNQGKFERFYENGNPSQVFYFDKYGKRDGVQKYYYENGKVKLIGTWIEGKEHGDILYYDESGLIVKVKKIYVGNLIDVIYKEDDIKDYISTIK